MCNISRGGSLLKDRHVCVLAIHTALRVHPPVCGLLLFVLGSTEVLKIVHGEVTASVTTSEHPFLICDLAFVDQHAAVRFRVRGCFGGRNTNSSILHSDPEPEETDFLQPQLRPQNRPD